MVSEPEQPANVTALRATPRPRPQLPAQPTRLIGREAEVAAALSLLDDPAVRLLTFTGPAGIGKTRLALAVAEHAAPAFAACATFVDLAPVREADLVMPAIARAVGIEGGSASPPLAALQRVLGARHVLLVLDNFEHVLPAAATLAALLEACPDVKVLATSRAPLRLRWEQELPLGPLAVPDPTHLPPPAALAAIPAVALFVERARAARPAFALTEANAAAVAALCVRLEGVPLAIELAAAWLRLLPPQAILERLGRRLDLLTGGAQDLPARQRTLRDALAWSYHLLSPQEQAFFRRLGVFVGGWTLTAAEAVCATDELAGEGVVLEGLGALVQHSLVLQDEGADGEPRYRMLELVREYALEQLAASEQPAVHERHAAYLLVLAERAEPELRSPRERVWLDRLEAERANLAAVLAWAIEQGDAETALRLCRALLLFWLKRESQPEGRHWAVRALELEGGSTAARAGATLAAAMLVERTTRADFERIQRLLEESLTLFQQLGDTFHVAWSTCLLGQIAALQGDFGTARARVEESVALAQEIGEAWGIAATLLYLGLVEAFAGNLEEARARYEKSLALCRRGGDSAVLSGLLSNLAHVALREGDHGRARAYWEELLASTQELGNRTGLALPLEGLGWVWAAEGHVVRAARLLGAAAELRATTNITLALIHHGPHEETVSQLRAALGEETFAEAWAAGTAMTLEEAIAEALARPTEPLPDGPSTARDRLTAREREVLRLLAAGHTNRGIAEALVLSRRTVDRHLANIYAKIGAQGRADAAAYAVRRHLIPSS